MYLLNDDCACATCREGGAVAPGLGLVVPPDAVAGTATDQRQAFDDFLSLLSLLSIVINLTR